MRTKLSKFNKPYISLIQFICNYNNAQDCFVNKLVACMLEQNRIFCSYFRTIACFGTTLVYGGRIITGLYTYINIFFTWDIRP